MLEFLSANWVWILLVGAMLWMMVGHGGHGGCGSHGHSGGQHGGHDHRHEEPGAEPYTEDPHYPEGRTGGQADPAPRHHHEV